MGDDIASRIGWGVVLSGDATDLDDWKAAFKQPFDPWVTETKDGLIFRSKQLEAETTASEAHERALPLMDWANGALAVSHGARAVRLEAIAEFLSDGSCRRHVFVQISGAEARDKVGMVGIVVGPDGRPITAPPEPSNPQRWLCLAAKDDLLADALTYFGRGDDWFDTYKALECLELRFGGAKKFCGLDWVNADEITLLKHTANYKLRHARLRFEPPDRPMERTEARDLLAKLIARALDEARATPEAGARQ